MIQSLQTINPTFLVFLPVDTVIKSPFWLLIEFDIRGAQY